MQKEDVFPCTEEKILCVGWNLELALYASPFGIVLPIHLKAWGHPFLSLDKVRPCFWKAGLCTSFHTKQHQPSLILSALGKTQDSQSITILEGILDGVYARATVVVLAVHLESIPETFPFGALIKIQYWKLINVWREGFHGCVLFCEPWTKQQSCFQSFLTLIFVTYARESTYVCLKFLFLCMNWILCLQPYLSTTSSYSILTHDRAIHHHKLSLYEEIA